MSASDRMLGSRRELDLSKPISVAYQLKLSHTSVLDSTFIDAKSRRAIYMTVTHDGATSLIRLSEHGEETVVGEVWWRGGRGNHGGPGHALVVVHEQTMRFEDFLKRSNGFLKNKYSSFRLNILQQTLTTFFRTDARSFRPMACIADGGVERTPA